MYLRVSQNFDQYQLHHLQLIRHPLHRAGVLGAERHQETHRLLIDQPHGRARNDLRYREIPRAVGYDHPHLIEGPADEAKPTAKETVLAEALFDVDACRLKVRLAQSKEETCSNANPRPNGNPL